MVRFPSFMKGRGKLKKEEKKKDLAMKGWDDAEMAKPKMAMGPQQKMSRGVGHHLARMAGITRSRGQHS